GHRLRALEPARDGLPDRRGCEYVELRCERLPRGIAALHSRGDGGPLGRGRSGRTARRGQGRHSRAGGARLAPRKRAQHRADLRHAPPGPREENLGAAEVSLSDEDMAAIEARLARIEVTGERLPPAILKLSYR